MKFKACAGCDTHDCCAGKEFLGEPMAIWLTQEEAIEIAGVTNVGDFYRPSEESRFGRILHDEKGGCKLLGPKGCTVPGARPFDCRIFPFTVLLEDDKYFLARHADFCPDNLDWTNEDFDEIADFARPWKERYAIERCAGLEVIREL